MAKNSLISAKRFDLVQKYMKNPVGEFDKVKAMYEENTTLYTDPQIGDTHFKEFNEKHFIEECIRLIEIAIQLGDQRAAQQIRKMALEIVNDNRLRDDT